MRKRWRILVEGNVQGVGFRPFVYELAIQKGLAGFVYNDASGVTIEVEGPIDDLHTFLQAMRQRPPALASITHTTCVDMPSRGGTTFAITPSQTQKERRVLVSPDVSTCEDCLNELFTPTDRRYHYPFINCTSCGPRFTITKDVPYDRELTTMVGFEMCSQCSREYQNPTDRRFHAQPNACSRCGPEVRLRDSNGDDVHSAEPLHDAAVLLRKGAIIAIKGLGGYHLACNACDDEVVGRLRQRKHRTDKPFAIMVKDLETAMDICEVDVAEAELITSRKRPIVLLKKLEKNHIAHVVAPGHQDLGVMLPYTPLHHLLLDKVGFPLVMTSGNLSEEPLAYQDQDALQRLRALTDYFISHNRDIHMPCDDSVARLLGGQELIIRRSRGYVPDVITVGLPFSVPILACGGQLKNTFCLGKRDYAFVSHHIGDLENYETFSVFVEGITHFQNMLDIQPAAIAHDLHPEYMSTKYAMEHLGITHIGVQHHHAHIASCMAEHGLSDTVIGVAFDGSGYGAAGCIWGGEFLVADLTEFIRSAHLQYIPMPGGEQAIRHPWRMAAAYLDHVYGDDMDCLALDFIRRLDNRRWTVVKQMIHKGVNCPFTSSVGRLFDAIASLIGIRDVVHYEGQAAVELEMLADEACQERYPYALSEEQLPHILEVGEILKGVVIDLIAGVSTRRIAAKFHNTLIDAIVYICANIRRQTALDRVVLSGGVFQNMFLLKRVVYCLSAQGFQVYVPHRLPTNDGGISLGQAVIANARIAAGIVDKPAGESAVDLR